MGTVRVAAVQATPVYLDREATVERAVALIEEAAANGARLIVFGEAFVAGYPDWVWRTRPWHDGAWFQRWAEQAVSVPGPATERLGEAARAAGAWVAIGINERPTNGSTIYNSLLYLDDHGEVAGVHRKLMPTGGERLVWGFGDGSDLVAHDTPAGRVSGLICWENYMPLARTAVFGLGISVYLAPTWDNSDVWVPTLRHIAKEGGVYVVGVTPLLSAVDVRGAAPGLDELYDGDDDWLSQGNTTIVAPGGEVLAGPLTGEAGIIYADVEPGRAVRQRRLLDVVGHYSRSDVFQLHVNTEQKLPVQF
jgi:nitrilase